MSQIEAIITPFVAHVGLGTVTPIQTIFRYAWVHVYLILCHSFNGKSNPVAQPFVYPVQCHGLLLDVVL